MNTNLRVRDFTRVVLAACVLDPRCRETRETDVDGGAQCASPWAAAASGDTAPGAVFLESGLRNAASADRIGMHTLRKRWLPDADFFIVSPQADSHKENYPALSSATNTTKMKTKKAKDKDVPMVLDSAQTEQADSMRAAEEISEHQSRIIFDTEEAGRMGGGKEGSERESVGGCGGPGAGS